MNANDFFRHQMQLSQGLSDLGGGMFGGLFGTSTSGNSLQYQLTNRQIAYSDYGSAVPQPAKATPDTHCEWLDRRVNEMRIKL